MSWGPTRVGKNKAEVILDFESVEFIALELPQRDGFTRDWWNDVYMPMVKQREEEQRERDQLDPA